MSTAARYLLDEHLGGPLWRAILRHNAAHPGQPLDVVRVGDPSGPPAGTLDPVLIAWAESNGRVLVTSDRQTLLGLLFEHLATGASSPGVFLLPKRFKIPSVVEFLTAASYASEASEWVDRVTYV